MVRPSLALHGPHPEPSFPLRVAELGYLACFLAVRVFYFVIHRPAEVASRHEQPARSGSVAARLLRLVALLALLASVVLTFFLPHWMPVALWVPFAPRWRVAAAALGWAAVLGWVAVHEILGDSWTIFIALRPKHQLVTSGPYAWVRHPMYVVLALFGAASLVSTGSLPLATALLGTAASAAARVPDEERMMLLAFGPVYAAYRDRVGAFLPRRLLDGRFCPTPVRHWLRDGGVDEHEVDQLLDAWGASAADATADSTADSQTSGKDD